MDKNIKWVNEKRIENIIEKMKENNITGYYAKDNDDLRKTLDLLINDGDTVSVIKDLKLKGSSTVIKVGTRVKNIRLVEGDHNIDCKVSGIGAIKLKSEFVKQV